MYKITCKDCEATYIGQTKRQLGTRLQEHVMLLYIYYSYIFIIE